MTRRLPIVVVLLGSVLLALLVDRAASDDQPAAEPAVPDAEAFPIASAASDLSSTWYCAGGSSDEESFADHSIFVANPASEPVDVTVTIFAGRVAPPPQGAADPDDEAESTTTAAPTTAAPSVEPVVERLEVGPQSRARLRLGDLVQAPVASALVEASVGGIVVEHRVQSVHGFDAKPCATGAASEWHFAWGDTTVDAREMLVLFNPFPEDVIVDGRFSTEDGVREPVRFDGLLVPARGTLGIDLGDDVTRRREVAASITARRGRRIVVDRIQRIDRETERGLTVQLGVPEPQASWVFPDGFRSDAVHEQYVVYNPGDAVAEVEVTFSLDEPETNGVPEPVDLSLAPGTHQVVDVNEDGRVPGGVGHSASVRSANGEPVVVERVVFSERENRRGVAVTSGSPVEATTWTFAAGAANDGSDEYLVLLNQDPELIAEVDVDTLAGGQRLPVADLQGVELGPGERRVIALDEFTESDSLPLVVTATEPIVVERGLYRRTDEARGMSNSIGVPSPAGLRLPIDPLDVAVDADLGELEDPEGDGEGESDGGTEAPEAPDDVELPAPDETIVIGGSDDDEDDSGDGGGGGSSTTGG